MRLTISIPTYNRNETLLKNLALLLPQVTDECMVRIFDNYSDVPVEETLRPLLARYPNVRCEVLRNRGNVGANANILRCFEYCETDWLWVLSDDDPARPDAVALILASIPAGARTVAMNFSYDGVRRNAYTTRGLTDFLERLDYSANLPWISTSVYNASAMIPYLKYGFQYTYAMLPHVALLLASITDDAEVFFSPEHLIMTGTGGTAADQQWSGINFSLGFSTLYELPQLDTRSRELLARKLLRTNAGKNPQLRGIVWSLLDGKYDRPTLRYLYRQIIARSFVMDLSLRNRLEIIFYRVLINVPALSRRILPLLYRVLKGKAIYRITPDRFERI